MKTNILLTSSFFWLTGFAFANTYVWEDYDDFSGSTLDTSKWEAVYFAGGQEASIESGNVKLMGSAYYPGSPTKVPSALSAAVAGSTEGNAGILISDSTVFGVEVELTLPLSNNSYEAGVFLDIKDTNPLRGLGHEIRYTSSGTSLGYSFLNTFASKEYSSANASLDTAHKIRVTKINGKMSYFLDGNLLKEFTNNIYDSDYWLIGAFNDNGSSFVAYADNVRVLRQASTTSLDGSIFSLSSTDGVSETLSFENGTFASAFVDSQKITTITSNQSYILDPMSSNSWKITLNDGDVYSFDSSAGTGSLTDYENGIMDTSGSWNFTYKRNNWMDYDDFSGSTLDTTKWEVGYWAGGETVTIVNGQAQLSGSAYSPSSPSQMPSDFANAGQDATGGNNYLFIKDATIIGLEADIMIPNTGNQNEAGIYLSTTDTNPLGSLGFELLKTATGSSFNYDYFNDQGSKILGYEAGSLDTFHKIKMTELNGQTSYYLDNKLIKQFASTSHDSVYWGIGSFSDNGRAYTTYADNVRVLRKWEDYDDFSSGSLNASKWGMMYFYGGDKPEVKDGRVEFSSSGKSASASSDFKQGWNSTEFINYTEGAPGSVLYVNDSAVYGIEATVTLPQGSSPKTAICLQVGSLNSFGQHIAELMNDKGNGSSFWIHDYVADSGISTQSSTETTFKVSVINDNQKNIFYINNVKMHELDATNFIPDWFGINTFESNGQAYKVYADNVRVLRRNSNLPLINVAPAKIEGDRDLVYLQSPSGPSLLAGASEIDFDLELADRPTVSAATLKVDGNVFDITQNQGPTAFRTRYGYGTGEPNELYDIESSSTSDWSAYANGKRFEFDLLIGGNQYTYSHDLPGEAELPTPPSPSISGAGSWKKDQSGHDYVEVSEAENYVVSWDPFVTSDSNDFIVVSLVEQIGDEEKDILGDLNLTAATSSYEISGNLLEKNKSYLFYVGFSNVVQSENPAGFTHSTDSNTTKSLLRTSANSITAIAFMVKSADPVTVVSDPSGKAVVVQVENEYKWNSSLDGVTLWTVAKSSDGWGSMTMRFENGRNYGNKGFYDSIALPQTYDMLFVIDENGYIKVTETSGYQYYNAVSVENGIVGTIQNDEGSASVANNGINQVDQWFFTTRAAAEEYYYSKVNPKDWLWFDQYPWVYSNERQDWLYFMPSGGKLMYYSHKYKAWREFSQ